MQAARRNVLGRRLTTANRWNLAAQFAEPYAQGAVMSVPPFTRAEVV
jgi:hypothetical protein